MKIEKNEKAKKLVANLHDKTDYFKHMRNLQQALNHGLILKGVQNAWLKSYIDTNTDLRKTAKTNFQKDFFKALILREMELSSCYIKKILIFPVMKLYTFRTQPSKIFLKNFFQIFSKEIFSYISLDDTLHFLALALKIKKSIWRKLLTLQEIEAPKNFL